MSDKPDVAALIAEHRSLRDKLWSSPLEDRLAAALQSQRERIAELERNQKSAERFRAEIERKYLQANVPTGWMCCPTQRPRKCQCGKYEDRRTTCYYCGVRWDEQQDAARKL